VGDRLDFGGAGCELVEDAWHTYIEIGGSNAVRRFSSAMVEQKECQYCPEKGRDV
jgi:hypothetical protein